MYLTKSSLLRLVAAMALVAATMFTGGSVTRTSASASAIVTSSPSNFESGDGDMVLTPNTSGDTDWNCFVGSDNFQKGTPPSGCRVTTGAVHLLADAPPAGESTWVSGQKLDAACPSLTTGSVPAKDDFTDIASYNETASNGDVYFYGGTIRSASNGNSSGNVELNQHQSTNPSTTSGCRTPGDKLIAYDYLNGGTNLSLHVLTWIQDPNGAAPCFVTQHSSKLGCWANPTALDATLYNGQSNQAAIAAGDNGINGAPLMANQFAEFGVNLTKALFPNGLAPGSCFAFPQEVWESRSSGSSFTSNPEDIEIEPHTITNCGALGISKVSTKKDSNGNNIPLAGATFSVTNSSGTVVGSGTTDSNGSLCIDKLPVGTYTVTETGAPSGYAINTTPQTRTVSNSSTCANNSVTFEDAPLTDLSVTSTSETTGGTQSTITCVDSSGKSIGSNGPTDPAKVTASGLTPGTYTCTVTIDP